MNRMAMNEIIKLFHSKIGFQSDFYKNTANNFASVSGVKLSASNLLEITKLSIRHLIEVIIAHENFSFNNLGHGIRKYIIDYEHKWNIFETWYHLINLNEI